MLISLDAAILLAGAIALAIAGVAGVFRARTIVGPVRLDPQAARPLLVITLLAFSASLVVPAVFVNPIEDENSTTSPATASATSQPSGSTSLTLRQTVTRGLIGASAGLIVLLAGDATLRPRGTLRLGLALWKLPRGFTSGLLGSVILIPITFAVTLLTEWVYRSFDIDHPQAHELLTVLGRSDEPGLRAMVFVSALAIAPIFEEIFFRGHVQTLMVHMFSQLSVAGAPPTDEVSTGRTAAMRWLTVVIISALFALAHEPWMIPPIFILSIGLGYAYERTANLWTPIVMHAIFNVLNVSLFVNLPRH